MTSIDLSTALRLWVQTRTSQSGVEEFGYEPEKHEKLIITPHSGLIKFEWSPYIAGMPDLAIVSCIRWRDEGSRQAGAH